MTETIVECYAGHSYAERPKAFCQDGKRFEVQAIEAEWRSPEGKHFRVSVKNNGVYELIYHPDRDSWQIRENGIMEDG